MNLRETLSPFYQAQLLWLNQAKEIAPGICDWIGFYFKESFLLETESKGMSEDLILGAFIGEETEHTRIPISRGICGLALRTESVVNVPDVRLASEHIACSLKTRSELVIPLKDKSGAYIAELDIDSNQLNAFSAELENRFRDFAETFSQIIEHR